VASGGNGNTCLPGGMQARLLDSVLPVLILSLAPPIFLIVQSSNPKRTSRPFFYIKENHVNCDKIA
jgi:hypothetical protein